jgi:hypothetical protein
MTDILRLLLIILLLTAGLAAYFLVFGALFPHRVAKTQRVLNQTTGRAFLMGAVNFLFFGVIAIVLFSVAENAGGFLKGVITTPALVITGLLALMLTFGLSGVVNELGARLFPEREAWRQTVWGSVALTFACALPFVGWFLLLPYVSLTGFGAVILGFFQRENT